LRGAGSIEIIDHPHSLLNLLLLNLVERREALKAKQMALNVVHGRAATL
jgi:hypothetical protein